MAGAPETRCPVFEAWQHRLPRQPSPASRHSGRKRTNRDGVSNCRTALTCSTARQRARDTPAIGPKCESGAPLSNCRRELRTRFKSLSANLMRGRHVRPTEALVLAAWSVATSAKTSGECVSSMKLRAGAVPNNQHDKGVERILGKSSQAGATVEKKSQSTKPRRPGATSSVVAAWGE